MKKDFENIPEKKNYFLVEYIGLKNVIYNNKEELDQALDQIRKYNRRKTARFIVGNMTYEYVDDHIVLHAYIYNKLTNRCTITDLDNYTSQFTEKGLIADVYDKLITGNEERNNQNISYYPDINIAYFRNMDSKKDENVIKRIRYIPVLYNDDVKYLDESYIDNCLRYHAEAGDVDFFKNMIDTFKYDPICFETLDEMTKELDIVINQGYNTTMLYYSARKLYDMLVVIRNKDGSPIRDKNGFYQISRRRQRDFGFYVKNYNNPKEKSPTSYMYHGSEKKLVEMKRLRETILKQREAMIKALDNEEYEQLTFDFIKKM